MTDKLPESLHDYHDEEARAEVDEDPAELDPEARRQREQRIFFWNLGHGAGLSNRKYADRLSSVLLPRSVDHVETKVAKIPEDQKSRPVKHHAKCSYVESSSTNYELLGSVQSGGVLCSALCDRSACKDVSGRVETMQSVLLSYNPDEDTIRKLDGDCCNFLLFATAELTTDHLLKITLYLPPRASVKPTRWDTKHVRRELGLLLDKWDELRRRASHMIIQGDFNVRYDLGPEIPQSGRKNFSTEQYETYVAPVLRWIGERATFVKLSGPTCYKSEREPSTIDGVATSGLSCVRVDRVLIKPDGGFEWADNVDSEYIRHNWPDHLGLLTTYVHDTAPESALPGGQSQQLPHPATTTNTADITSENFLGHYEDFQVKDVHVDHFLLQHNRDNRHPIAIENISSVDAHPATHGIRIAMARDDKRHDKSTLQAAMDKHAVRNPPPRKCLLAFERWLASGLVANKLASIVKEPAATADATPPSSTPDPAHSSDASATENELPAHLPPAPGSVSSSVAMPVNDDSGPSATDAVLPPVSATGSCSSTDTPPAGAPDAACGMPSLDPPPDADDFDLAATREGLSFLDWAQGGPVGFVGSCIKPKGVDKSEAKSLFQQAAKVRELVFGTRKGEPLPELHSITDGVTTYTGSSAVIEQVMRTHVLKGDIIRAWYSGTSTELSKEELRTIKEDLVSVARDLPPLTFTRAQVRDFLADANPCLRGYIGVRLKVYAALSDDVLDAYVDCVNHVLLSLRNCGSSFTAVLPDTLKVLVLDLLGKGGQVKELKKIRTICRGSPALRILAGIIGRELLQLAEAHNCWGTTSMGSRPNASLALAMIRIVDTQLHCSDSRFFVQISEDICNYFNNLPLFFIMNNCRRARLHPCGLMFFLAANLQKELLGHNGPDAYCRVKNYTGGIQGSTETMYCGITLQKKINELVRLFLLACYCPRSRRLETHRILRASAALLLDLEGFHHSARSWEPYSRADVDQHFQDPSDPASCSLGKFDIFQSTTRALLCAILVQDGISEESAADLIAVVDDKALSILVHRDDLQNGNLARIFDTLRRATELNFKHCSQFFSKSKFEIVAGSPYWKGDANRQVLERVREMAVKYLNPFETTPTISLRTKLVGFLFNTDESQADTLYGQILARLKWSRIAAELVCKYLKRVSGPQLRAILVWAYISSILHLLVVAVRIFNDDYWEELLFQLAWSIMDMIGFSPEVVKACLERNKIPRGDIHKLAFSKKVLNMVDPRLLSTKILRCSSAKWTAASSSISVAAYATAPVTFGPTIEALRGFTAPQVALLQEISAADSYVRESLSGVLGSSALYKLTANATSSTIPPAPPASSSVARSGAATSSAMVTLRDHLLVPQPASSDRLSTALLRNVAPPRTKTTAPPPSFHVDSYLFRRVGVSDLHVVHQGVVMKHYTCVAYSEFAAADLRADVRFAANVGQALEDLLPCPSVLLSRPRVDVVGLLLTSNLRDAAVYRILTSMIWRWPGKINFYAAPAVKATPQLVTSVPPIVVRNNILDLAAKDVGVSWPVRDFEIPFDFKLVDEKLSLQHIRNRVNARCKTILQKTTTIGARTGGPTPFVDPAALPTISSASASVPVPADLPVRVALPAAGDDAGNLASLKTGICVPTADVPTTCDSALVIDSQVSVDAALCDLPPCGLVPPVPTKGKLSITTQKPRERNRDARGPTAAAAATSSKRKPVTTAGTASATTPKTRKKAKTVAAVPAHPVETPPVSVLQ